GLKETNAGLQISAATQLLISARGSGAGLRSSLPVIADADALRAGEAAHFLSVSQNVSTVETFSGTLRDPQNSATLNVYGTAGVKLCTLSLSGGPQTAPVALRTVLKTDIPLARTFLVVAQGKAAAQLLATDQISGDTVVTAPQRYFEGSADVL